jgi:hypothetical protein
MPSTIPYTLNTCPKVMMVLKREHAYARGDIHVAHRITTGRGVNAYLPANGIGDKKPTLFVSFEELHEKYYRVTESGNLKPCGIKNDKAKKR